MSRVAKKPISLPKGVELKVAAEGISVKGPKGSLSVHALPGVNVAVNDGVATIVKSSDPLELAGLCDRVVVMSRGRIVDEIVGDDLGERRIVEAIVGSGLGRASLQAEGEGTSA